MLYIVEQKVLILVTCNYITFQFDHMLRNHIIIIFNDYKHIPINHYIVEVIVNYRKMLHTIAYYNILRYPF